MNVNQATNMDQIFETDRGHTDSYKISVDADNNLTTWETWQLGKYLSPIILCNEVNIIYAKKK